MGDESRMTGTPDIAQLFDGTGRRKYSCDSELVRFRRASRKTDRQTRIFCQL
ncbi:hypothetical protein OY671_008638, partial [Metschnikowia pulcherrima]